MKRPSPSLVIAIVLLVVPVLYVGSYLALVKPGPNEGTFQSPGREPQTLWHYRVPGWKAETFSWPLEQIDRKFRPKSWREYGELGGVI